MNYPLSYESRVLLVMNHHWDNWENSYSNDFVFYGRGEEYHLGKAERDELKKKQKTDPKPVLLYFFW